jgi:hypothetical protein
MTNIRVRARVELSSGSHSTRWTIFRTRRSASVDDASLLKY